MKFHTILLLLLLIGVSAFTVLNWNLFTSPSELSLGLTSIQMPFACYCDRLIFGVHRLPSGVGIAGGQTSFQGNSLGA